MPYTQGCLMAYFQTKNPNLGQFWRVMQWNMLVYFVAIWLFGIFFPFWFFVPRQIWQPCLQIIFKTAARFSH
jgi:hypothetical protein